MKIFGEIMDWLCENPFRILALPFYLLAAGLFWISTYGMRKRFDRRIELMDKNFDAYKEEKKYWNEKDITDW